jgi:hypothetical protein
MDQEPARQRRIEQPMMSVRRWTTALRALRRDKRVERLGGYPTRVPELTVDAFEPVLNHSERLHLVTDGVSRLGAESVDEGTAYPLDNLVNAQGHEWQSRLSQQYYAYQAAGRRRLRQLQGVVEQYRHLYELDTLRLRDAEIAAESAMLTLSGDQPDLSHHGTRQAVVAPAVAYRDPGPVPVPGQEDPLAWPTALVPPRVSRAELRRIFEPRDANRVPQWAEPGFRDATLLAGRPRSTYVHILVLLIAAGADIGAFSQVVERAMPDQTDLMVYLVVGGLAAVVLYIAHMIGVMLREAKATHPRGASRRVRLWSWTSSRVAPTGCAVAWGALGLLAYWVRIHVPPPTTAQVGVATIGGGSAPSGTSTDPHAMEAALLFLGLYVATGIVAAVGAYFTHNPYRGRYMAALRGYRKAAERAAASANQLGRAEASCQRQVTELQNADSILAAAQAQDKAFTEQLKQSVRLQIATMARDPAVTDAIFDEDRDPYWRSNNGSASNGHGVPRP